MTTAGFLTLCIAAGAGLLGTLLTVAIAGPVHAPTPTAQRPATAARPADHASGPASPTSAMAETECRGECWSAGELCRFHRGFAAGWTAARHHDVAVDGPATTDRTSDEALGRTA